MRIGIDIDGVLTDLDRFQFDYFSKFCVDNKIPYKITKSDYDISVSFGLSDKQENLFWDKYLDFYANEEKARDFSSEVIKKLKDEGYEIYIITARWLTNRKDDAIGEKMRKTVKDWLKRNDIVYDKLIFSNAAKERKIDEIKKYKVDVMIEDSPNNIRELSKHIPIICYDASYNKDCRGKNIFRCYSWYDIYKNIHQFENSFADDQDCFDRDL